MSTLLNRWPVLSPDFGLVFTKLTFEMNGLEHFQTVLKWVNDRPEVFVCTGPALRSRIRDLELWQAGEYFTLSRFEWTASILFKEAKYAMLFKLEMSQYGEIYSFPLVMHTERNKHVN